MSLQTIAPVLGIIVPATGSPPSILEIAEAWRAEDSRVHVAIVAASASEQRAPSIGELSAVAASAPTPFVTVIVPGVKLAPGAISALIDFLVDHPEADVVYGDEGHEDAEWGVRWLRKPDFSPERLRCQFYYGDVVVYRRETFISLGGLNPNAGAASAYDLALRASRDGAAAHHLPTVLTLRSTERPLLDQDALRDTRAVLEHHLAATGGGTVRRVDPRGVHDTVREVVGEPLVSIVIPTRGLFSTGEGHNHSFVIDAVRSIVEVSTWTAYELVLVIDDIADQGVVDQLRLIAGERLTLVWWSQPFNFSSKVNLGALHSHGEYILLLNDDITVITPDWLERLLALAQLPGAGMSGAMLYYEDDTIQHAGHTYHRGDASHIGMFVPRGVRGPSDGYLVEREVPGVTAACAMMPMSVFREVGALSSLLPGAFNDVDLCMKVTWRGYDIYWTPHAELYHFESKTRDASVHANEVSVAWGRWAFRMHDTRYWPYPIDLTHEQWRE